MDFKVPSLIPQDLQIIQDLIGELPPPPAPKSATPETRPQKPSEDSVDSSDNESDTDSEREVEDDILGDVDSEPESTLPMYVPFNHMNRPRLNVVKSYTDRSGKHERLRIIRGL